MVQYIIQFKFFKKFLKYFINNNNIRLKKKNLFFKKKQNNKLLFSKRLSIYLKKKKTFKNFYFKKGFGNFFFKKFFFKTILKARKNLKLFFFKSISIIRSKKITKSIFKNTKYIKNINSTYEYNIVNVLLRAHFFIFWKDILSFIKNGFVYVNNISYKNINLNLNQGDLINISLNKISYKYIQFFKKSIKKNIFLYKRNLWDFFKQKKKKNNVFKKKKTPIYINTLYLYKYNTPKYLEIDYITLTIVILKKFNFFKNNTYFLYKSFSYKLFSLYNFKKIN